MTCIWGGFYMAFSSRGWTRVWTRARLDRCCHVEVYYFHRLCCRCLRVVAAILYQGSINHACFRRCTSGFVAYVLWPGSKYVTVCGSYLPGCFCVPRFRVCACVCVTSTMNSYILFTTRHCLQLSTDILGRHDPSPPLEYCREL